MLVQIYRDVLNDILIFCVFIKIAPAAIMYIQSFSGNDSPITDLLPYSLTSSHPLSHLIYIIPPAVFAAAELGIYQRKK